MKLGLLIGSGLFFALIATTSLATEFRPAMPDLAEFRFATRLSDYTVKISSKEYVEVFCDKRFMFGSKIEDLRKKSFGGSIVGVDLTIEDESTCSRSMTIGFYIRDFSRPGGEKLFYRIIGFVDGKAVVAG